jgi:hypothetical protein
MKARQGADYDFSGVNRQTTVFHAGDDHAAIHQSNRRSTESFISGLGSEGGLSPRRNALVWRAVDFDCIANFLGSFAFHPRAQFFSEIELFVKWYRDHAHPAGYEDWNVVVAGKVPQDVDRNQWSLPGGTIRKVARTRIRAASTSDSVSIGTLRDPIDLLSDADSTVVLSNSPRNHVVAKAREAAGLGRVPQLLLYMIDKDSNPAERELGKPDNERVRDPLGVEEDIVGISLWLPKAGQLRRTFITHLTVRIPQDLVGEDDDIEDSGSGSEA